MSKRISLYFALSAILRGGDYFSIDIYIWQDKAMSLLLLASRRMQLMNARRSQGKTNTVSIDAPEVTHIFRLKVRKSRRAATSRAVTAAVAR